MAETVLKRASETEIKSMTDYEIIKRCVNGDKEIFSELVSRYKNLVYSLLLRMVNDPEEANDLAQEIFVKVYLNLSKYYPDYKFSTWIIRISTNHVIDYRRKKRQETVPIDDIEYELSSESSPESEYLEKERGEQLNHVVEKLPEMYKIPIVLYHQQGLSYQEIADVINEPLSKVKNRIFRGRKMLKDSLLKLREGEGFGL